MEEEIKPKRKRGGQTKVPELAGQDKPVIETRGRKRKYERIDVAADLETLNFGIIKEYTRLYAQAVQKDDMKLQEKILSELLKYCAPTMRPIDPGVGDDNPMMLLLQSAINQLGNNQRPPPKGS